MTRTARFHADPLAHEVAECLEDGCDTEHHELEVRGAHSTEKFSCEHHVHVVVWHELTPSDHPEPACEHGCAMARELIG